MTVIQHLTKETKKKIQKKTPRNEKTTRHLLGEFYSDKKYLENLLKDKGTVLLPTIFTSNLKGQLILSPSIYLVYLPANIIFVWWLITNQCSADLMRGKTKNGEQLRDVIQNSLSYLETCTEFWSQEKPICSWEREHKVMEHKCSKPRQNAPSEPAEFLLKSLDAIDEGTVLTHFCLNLRLSVFYFSHIYKVYIFCHRFDVWKCRG